MSQDDTLSTISEQDEEWRDVPGYEGMYRVSSYGRVESQRRTITYKDGRQYVIKRKMLRPYVGKDGRPAVALYRIRRQGKTYKVYRLVLLAFFVGPCLEGEECRHLDGNPLNNRFDNLCWSTHAENMGDMPRHGTSTIGEKNPRSKLTAAEVSRIRCMYATGNFTQQYLAFLFNTTQGNIGNIIRLDAWQCVAAEQGLARHHDRFRFSRGESNHFARTTEGDVREMRRLYEAAGRPNRGPFSQVGIAARFGISGAAARKILLGETWRHVV